MKRNRSRRHGEVDLDHSDLDSQTIASVGTWRLMHRTWISRSPIATDGRQNQRRRRRKAKAVQRLKPRPRRLMVSSSLSLCTEVLVSPCFSKFPILFFSNPFQSFSASHFHQNYELSLHARAEAGPSRKRRMLLQLGSQNEKNMSISGCCGCRLWVILHPLCIRTTAGQGQRL